MRVAALFMARGDGRNAAMAGDGGNDEKIKTQRSSKSSRNLAAGGQWGCEMVVRGKERGGVAPEAAGRRIILRSGRDRANISVDRRKELMCWGVKADNESHRSDLTPQNENFKELTCFEGSARDALVAWLEQLQVSNKVVVWSQHNNR